MNLVFSRSVILLGSVLLALPPSYSSQQARPVSFRAEIHQYLEKNPRDPFSLIKDEIETKGFPGSGSGPLDYLKALLEKLEVSIHSQQLVFSTTSLQLSMISPRNPRAIYFNEDVYLGYVPGGQIEVIGIDPGLGSIPYIFSPPSDLGRAALPKVIRSRRCMNCHAADDLGGFPALLLSSVIPGPGGGSIDAFRKTQTGHSVPYDLRFGGWHLTGSNVFASTWANSTGLMHPKGISKIPVPPGTRFKWDKYLVPRSEVVPSLVLEHQVGFVNRCIGASYRAREIRADPKLDEVEKMARMAKESKDIVEYALFADEARLPNPVAFAGSPYAKAFEAKGLQSPTGLHLRKFNLKDRLFQRRCSYMLHSLSFQGLPDEIRGAVLSEIKGLMTMDQAALPPRFAYLGRIERSEIHETLSSTFPPYASVK